MTNNTVTLDLEKYNKLRDFKKSIEAGEVCVIINSNIFTKEMGEWKFYKADKLDKIIVEENKKLSIALNYARNSNVKLLQQIANKDKPEPPKEPTIDEIKQMSYWEFLKWKKSQK
jgi:hypothetical protein